MAGLCKACRIGPTRKPQRRSVLQRAAAPVAPRELAAPVAGFAGLLPPGLLVRRQLASHSIEQAQQAPCTKRANTACARPLTPRRRPALRWSRSRPRAAHIECRWAALLAVAFEQILSGLCRRQGPTSEGCRFRPPPEACFSLALACRCFMLSSHKWQWKA